MMISQRLVCRTPTKMREEHRCCALIRCYAFRNNSGSLAIFNRDLPRLIFAEQLCSRNRDLAVGSGSPNASPKAKENGGPDHHRDHNCVP
jgi:hypothetical protein